jgi:hypothetical protein
MEIVVDEKGHGVRDWVLVVWLLLSVVWDVLVFGVVTYVVFWRDRSGLWFVLAFILTYTSTLYKVLRKRYGIPEEKED